MKIKETQVLRTDDVRIMCIEHNLYTHGNIAEYEAMFSKVRGLAIKDIITADDLYPIALDILHHSETELDMASIMWELGDKIVRFYEVEE